MYWLKNNWFFLAATIFLLMYLAFPQTPVNQAIQTEKQASPVLDETKVEVDENSVEREEITAIKVDIKGEIESPGIYEMSGTNRVSDLIETAGGLTEKADATQVNLAQKLVDEMVVYIPGEGEENNGITSNLSSQASSGGESKVNLNRATKEEIMSLNGIGEKKADAILAYREENGPFSSAEDLLNVSGIGEKTLENFLEMIQVP